MEGGSRSPVAVLAQYVPHQVGVLPGHGSVCDLSVHITPHTGHVLHRPGAGGAGVQTLRDHVRVTLHMQEVATGGNVSIVPGCMDILHTNRTVVL